METDGYLETLHRNITRNRNLKRNKKQLFGLTILQPKVNIT